jgi:hypothetical protein
LVQVSSTSPFAGSVPGSFLNSEVEPSIAADPGNPNHLVGAWQQDRFSDAGARGIITGVSYDGGNHWTLTPVPGATLVAGGSFERVTDPWVSFARNGDVYLAVSPFDASDFNQAMFVYKSTDGGNTFGSPTSLISEGIPNAIDDKESVTADPTNSSFAYYTWDRLFFDPNTFNFISGPTWFSRTTDGGRNWEAAHVIFDGGTNTQTIGNQIVVLPNGTVEDFFTFFDFNTGNESVALIRSTDHGATWSGPITVGAIERINPFDPNNGCPLRTGEDLPAVAVDPRNGTLYAAWVDARFNGFNYNSVVVSISSDRGLTWSAPVQVNQTPTSIALADQQAFTPSIAVSQNGTVAVSYYDLRNPDQQTAGLPTDFWMVFGRPQQDLTQAGNWGSEQRLTTSSFNMELAPFVGGFFLGDYMGLTAGGHDGNSFAALFTQAVSASDPSSEFFRYVKPTGNDSGGASSLASPSAFIAGGLAVGSSVTNPNAGTSTLTQNLQFWSDMLAAPLSNGDRTAAAPVDHPASTSPATASLARAVDVFFASEEDRLVAIESSGI